MSSKKNTSSKLSSLRPDSTKPSTLAGHMAETAWRVAVPFFIFSLGGIWLDTLFDSDPLFTLIGITVALVTISVIVYRYVHRYFPDSFPDKGEYK